MWRTNKLELILNLQGSKRLMHVGVIFARAREQHLHLFIQPPQTNVCLCCQTNLAAARPFTYPSNKTVFLQHMSGSQSAFARSAQQLQLFSAIAYLRLFVLTSLLTTSVRFGFQDSPILVL